jgi:hypothetical protein
MHALSNFTISDSLHLKRVKTAEISDLIEGQGSILDQPHGGRLGH